MLGYFTPHEQYVRFALGELKQLSQARPDQINEHKEAILKMLILNLDPLEAAIASLYPPIGRTAELQMEIFRSLVLMKHMHVPLNNWVEKLTNNPVLRAVAGFSPENMPSTSSYYDLINRIVPLDERPTTKPVKRKPRTKLGKNEKLPPKNPNITAKLAEFILYDEKHFLRRLSGRAERFLQKIFAQVAVVPSINMGLIPNEVDISGDGTCIETGASHYGKKICDCAKNGNYKCDCPRKFSDPNATWGWDSSKEQWFYGYTGYFISTYNKDLKTDLPLYIRFVEASRHDSVSAIVSLAEFGELYQQFNVNTFISDSASDNYATYELLNHWGINAVIALNSKNKGQATYPTALSVDNHGRPTCPGGRQMTFFGFCRDRCRLKWRCPRVTKGLEPCDACDSCSKSPYGRVIYTKPNWDLRLFTCIPRGSDEWKDKMKQRTAAERVNNRILNDYGIEHDAQRGKKRIAFFSFVAAINVHLDAQCKFLAEHPPLDFSHVFNFLKEHILISAA